MYGKDKGLSWKLWPEFDTIAKRDGSAAISDTSLFCAGKVALKEKQNDRMNMQLRDGGIFNGMAGKDEQRVKLH